MTGPGSQRLIRFGWPPDDIRAVARTIAQRAPDDGRRTCAECAHYRPGRCVQRRRARLLTDEIGRDWASLPQRCPAWQAVTVTNGADAGGRP